MASNDKRSVVLEPAYTSQIAILLVHDIWWRCWILAAHAFFHHGTRNQRPVRQSLVNTTFHRISPRLHGLSSEFAILSQEGTPTAAPASRGPESIPSFPTSYSIFEYPNFWEDAQDWLNHFERVASNNGLDDATRICNVCFSLVDATRTWHDNREATLSTWHDIRSQLLYTYTSGDCRERAERTLSCRIQLPNKSVAMYVK